MMLMIKYSSVFFSVMYMLSSILNYFELHKPVISLVASISFVPMLILYYQSVVFQFCIWHKLPWIYVMSVNIMNTIDYFTNVSSGLLLNLNVILFGIIFVLCAYFKNKYNEKLRSNKTSFT